MIKFPRGREVVLGVGAGIAAYKSCDLLRRLQDAGFLVSVVPTPSSLNFVGRATWEALSGRDVKTEVWEGTQSVSHVALADAADFVVIAPATADLISRLASGRADDLLTSTVLATRAKILVVPSMHPEMYLNPATQSNLQLLTSRGFHVMEPDVGRLTGRDAGVGRFPDTARILSEFAQISQRESLLKDKKIVVTAGGTVEAIDSVRYIGNRSSGRQGLAIAYEALAEGAEVTVIAGNTEEFDLPGARRINVTSAEEMNASLQSELVAADALVMAAAVADARPVKVVNEKIAKDEFTALDLRKNPDILAAAASTRRPNQVFVGFAAETGSDIRNKGLKKLHTKGVDLLYVTDVSGGQVFGERTTTGFLLSRNGEELSFKEVDKFVMAKTLVAAIAKELRSKSG